jgi:hypothetical protein
MEEKWLHEINLYGTLEDQGIALSKLLRLCDAAEQRRHRHFAGAGQLRRV